MHAGSSSSAASGGPAPLLAPGERAPIQSVARAIRLLKHLAASPRPLSVPALAAACGVQRTTAWRLLTTLEHEGLVERAAPTGPFRVGYGAVTIAASALDATSALVRAVHPILDELVASTGESAALSVIRGDRTLVVDEVDPPTVLSVRWFGKEFPLHTSSNGKILLASLPPAALDRLLERPLVALTPKTITDPAALRRELLRVRSRGVADSDEEFELGCVGLSTAVGPVDGTPTAILTVTGPLARVPQSRFETIAGQLRSAARLAEARLGHRHPERLEDA